MGFLLGKREKPQSRHKKVSPSSKNTAVQVEECCPDDPCLIFLRQAVIGERKAILFYLNASMECCELRDLFLSIAQDEMRHFVMTMRLISQLDPVQSAALEEANLDFLTMGRAMPPKWAKEYHMVCEEEPEITPPPQLHMCCLALLTHALTDELTAINDYQTFMEETHCEEVCRNLFCELMNDEKEHVAQLTAAMLDITNEPLTGEMD